MSIRAVHHLNCGMMPCDDRLARPDVCAPMICCCAPRNIEYEYRAR
jgi:hypothetical protein